jgi:hypothetical protein
VSLRTVRRLAQKIVVWTHGLQVYSRVAPGVVSVLAHWAEDLNDLHTFHTGGRRIVQSGRLVFERWSEKLVSCVPNAGQG